MTPRTLTAGCIVLAAICSQNGPLAGAAHALDETNRAGVAAAPASNVFLQAAADNVRRGRLLLSGRETPDGRVTFLLAKGSAPLAVVFAPGRCGLIDGTLTLVSAHAAASFDGLVVEIEGHCVRQPSGPAVPCDYHLEMRAGRAVHIHRLEIDHKPARFELALWPEGDGLRIGWSCDRRLSDFSLGDSNCRPRVVWFGHGYRVEEPQAAKVEYKGDKLSTSHIAAEYEGGLAILQALDTPPDSLEIDPQRFRLRLHGHQGGMFTLLAGEVGGMDCALRYRPLCGKEASESAAALAGRFVFDLWGGSFNDLDAQMQRVIRYGLTDAAVLVHVWQRWGYDFRFPDIWPPDPALGGLDALRPMAERCRRAGLLWGLHDNYRTIYPDATGFSFDRVACDSQGQPIKSWYNEKRHAQGYEWNPTQIMPFLEHNAALIRDNLHPSCGYLDTMGNKIPFDFYDHQGRFHSGLETREAWRQAFATYRRVIGGPMMSEAGHDSLVGYLDGAQCQFVPLRPDVVKPFIQLPCARWERVPWFDAVYHDRFIQSGVGAAYRFGGKPNCAASDDYLSLEILTGHALMATRPLLPRDAVRKYWLAQPVARVLALRQIRSWKMEPGDMRRQTVVWDDGTRVWVNRSPDDWLIEGHRLPQFGFLVKRPGMETAVERRGVAVCEHRAGPDDWYCNARGVNKSPLVDFGFAAADGGFRLERINGGLRLTPLPDSLPFQARLRLTPLGWPQATAAMVVAANGSRPQEGSTNSPLESKPQNISLQGGELALRHNGASFSYDIRFDVLTVPSTPRPKRPQT